MRERNEGEVEPMRRGIWRDERGKTGWISGNHGNDWWMKFPV